MAILKIARMGHPVLKRIAEPVADPTAPEIHKLINDMVDTLADIGGAGLAAPQVHVPLRVVIFRVPGARLSAEDGNDGETPPGIPLTALINPGIAPLSDEMVEGIEACLSVPGLAGMVPRYKEIRYRALAPDGSLIERVASGFHARVVQHECDHLDGLLYPMRMRDMSSLGFVEELRRFENREAED
ncbi:peptide deformylase [Dongia sp.]|uniref:peptide deformylase n=1 Tax=Dongia sp. TaxID=1977262 RepID=UPI0035B11701